MKNFRLRTVLAALVLTLLAAANLGAQSLSGMSFNGSTGLYSIPTGRTGWEKITDIGLDLGYHMIFKEEADHIPAVSVSLFKWLEISGAFDIQPNNDGADLLLGAKLQLPVSNTAIALGGNFQSLYLGSNDPASPNRGGQIYLAATYAGSFFNMPAETTVVFGKTFMKGSSNRDIDFGMGFDLLFFPDIFQNFIHVIVDFSNYAYSIHPFGMNVYRGILNTGIRIDLSAIGALSKNKFSLEVLLADAFDANRAFSAGLVFGVPLR